MDTKRGLILVLIVLLIVINLIHFAVITTITGQVTTEGNVSICIMRPPSIDSIPDQSATVSTAFTYQVGVTFYGDNTTTAFYDDTSLFNINQSGYINFTPTSTQVGTSTIEIIAEDRSGCLAVNSSDSFILTIAAAAAPGAAGGGGGGAGGGGGGAVAGKAAELIIPPEPILSFDLSEKRIKVIVKQSQSAEKTITVVNYGNAELEMTINNPLSEVEVSPESFTLSPGGEQDILLIFNPSRDTDPGIYTGVLAITGTHGNEKRTRTVALILEVESERVLFDGSIDLSKKSFFPGEELEYTVSISGLLPGTVTTAYTISDMNGKVIFTEEETVPVEQQVSFVKSAKLPSDLTPGQYVLALTMKSGESFATATELFTVEGQPSAFAGLAAPVLRRPTLIGLLPFILGISLIIILLAVYLLHRKVKGKTFVKERVIEKTVERTVIKPRVRVIIKRDTAALERKLLLLKEAYDKGFLKEETYRTARQKVQQRLEGKK